MASISNKLVVWGSTVDEYGSGTMGSTVATGFSAGNLIYAQEVNKAFRNATILTYGLAEVLATKVSSVPTAFDISYDIPTASIAAFVSNLDQALALYVQSRTKVNNAAMADAASAFSTSRTIQLTGDITGSASDTGANGWSIGTTIGSSKVLTGMISDSNITSAKIATSAVITAKISANAVTTAKIADANVTTAKIADSNVTTAKIADANITTAKIANSNITTIKIADSNVTNAKIENPWIGFYNWITGSASDGANYNTCSLGAWIPAVDMFGFGSQVMSSGFVKFDRSKNAMFVEPDIDGEDWKIIPNNFMSGNKHITNLAFPYASIVGQSAFRSTTLENISLPKVIYIESGAFLNTEQLTDFTVPSTLLEIGYEAFAHCGLSQLYISEGSSNLTIGVQAFSACTNLRRLNGKRIISINDYAFTGCTSLYFISLPNVEYIGTSAFVSTNLSGSINLPKLQSAGADIFSTNLISRIDASNLQSFGSYTFRYLNSLSYVNLTNTKIIPTSAFTGKTKLQTALIPNIELIYNYAFSNCSSLITLTTDGNNSLSKCLTIYSYAFFNTNLSKISLPNVTNLSNGVFTSCKNLRSISINKITTLPYATFSDCDLLSNVNIPSVTNIEGYAFYKCSNLSSLAIFGNLISIGGSAFANTGLSGTLNLPNCTYIGNYAFSSTKINVFSLPNLITLGDNVFYSCSLISISLPKLSRLEANALNGLSNLQVVRLGASCSYIAPGCFPHTVAFTSLYIGYPGLISYSSGYYFSSYYFSSTGITSTTGAIYVPTSLVNTYKNATGWNYFSNRIFGF